MTSCQAKNFLVVLKTIGPCSFHKIKPIPSRDHSPALGTPHRDVHNLFFLLWDQKVAKAAATRKAPEGPPKDSELPLSVYFRSSGRIQTNPTPTLFYGTCVFWEGQRTIQPPPPAGWHRKTHRGHHEGQPGLWPGLHHDDSEPQQQQQNVTAATCGTRTIRANSD